MSRFGHKIHFEKEVGIVFLPLFICEKYFKNLNVNACFFKKEGVQYN